MTPNRAPVSHQPLSGEATILGLESSCDDTAAAVLRRDRDGQIHVLAETVLGQNTDHAPYGGVVPEIAARAHAERLDDAARQVMGEAGLAFSDLDAIAATAGPGLVGGVLVGLSTAKGLALALDIPLVAINHLEAHALSPRLAGPAPFPYLALLVSGGHTQTVMVNGVGDYVRIGSTRDDAAGEAFDKTAKLMGLPMPGGPTLERLARTGDASRFAIPRPFRKADHGDFSFAGLKTAALRAWTHCEQSDQAQADLAASVQAAIADVLAERTGWALRQSILAKPDARGVQALAVVGGVAANGVVRAALMGVCDKHGLDFLAPPPKWCTDNAAMVALAGLERLALGWTNDVSVSARARWPLDERTAQSNPAVGSGRKGPKA